MSSSLQILKFISKNIFTIICVIKFVIMTLLALTLQKIDSLIWKQWYPFIQSLWNHYVMGLVMFVCYTCRCLKLILHRLLKRNGKPFVTFLITLYSALHNYIMYVSNTSLSSIVISWHYWKKRKKKKKMVLRYGIPVLSIFNVTVDHSFSYNNINCKSWEKQRYRKQIKFFKAKKK